MTPVPRNRVKGIIYKLSNLAAEKIERTNCDVISNTSKGHFQNQNSGERERAQSEEVTNLSIAKDREIENVLKSLMKLNKSPGLEFRKNINFHQDF